MTSNPIRFQPSLPGCCSVEAAVANMAAAGPDTKGAVSTRREAADFIQDLVGYTVDQPPHRARISERAAGQSDFLLPTIDRLFIIFWRLSKEQQLATGAAR